MARKSEKVGKFRNALKDMEYGKITEYVGHEKYTL
jgi:hypothetical protein